MNKKLWIAVGLVVGLVLVIGLGTFFSVELNFDYYTSAFDSNETSSLTTRVTEINGQKRNYSIELVKDGETIQTHWIDKGTSDENLNVLVNIEAFKYEGNLNMPFKKDFTIAYRASIESEGDFTRQDSVAGEVSGTIEASFQGLVSTKRAKELVEDKVIESIRDYVVNGLSTNK
jgi:hypothetical protein